VFVNCVFGSVCDVLCSRTQLGVCERAVFVNVVFVNAVNAGGEHKVVKPGCEHPEVLYVVAHRFVLRLLAELYFA